jgi:hypothetical protein
MTAAAAGAVRMAMDRIGQVRQAIAAGELAGEDIPEVYAELSELYVTACRSLERGETQLRVSKERI